MRSLKITIWSTENFFGVKFTSGLMWITLDNKVRRIYITGVKVVRQLIKMKGEGRVLAERSEAWSSSIKYVSPLDNKIIYKDIFLELYIYSKTFCCEFLLFKKYAVLISYAVKATNLFFETYKTANARIFCI